MLNIRELEFAAAIEQHFLLHGTIATYEQTTQLMRLPREFYDRCLNDDAIRDHLEGQGVPVKTLCAPEKVDGLSVEQLKCVNLLLDFNDNRSDRKKLESLGISTARYQAWKKDPAFQNYIRNRAENLFGENLDEVHRALLDNARSGDLGSVKLIYEMTGRYNPKNDGQLDAKTLVTQILEIIMQEVKDPEIIKNIAYKLQLIAAGNKIVSPTQVIDTVAQASIPA